MGPAGTAPLKWAPFPLGLPRMGGISAWAEPGQMGFQDGAGTSWDLLLIRALGGEAHVWLQQVISPCCQMGKGRGTVQGPGRWAPRASGGLRVKRLVGWAPQVRDPWRAYQRGGLPCVTPSPQGDPCAWGTCEGGGRPPGPPASAHGETWGWATAAPRTPLPILGLRSLCAQSHLWQRCVLGSASSVLASFSGSILCRPGVREAEKSLPTLPAPGPARVHSAAPRVPRGPGRAAPAQVRPGRRGVGTPGVRPSPGPPSAPERRGGGSRPQLAPSQSIWEGHLQIDSLSRPGWSRAAVAEARGLRCRGSRLRVDVSALEPPGWAERVGGALSRRSARACCCLHPAEACPSPAFPEPQAA